jgi:hypothetical protein
MGDVVTAWSDACERLEALGRRLRDDDFPGGDADRARGAMHLAEQVLCWTGWSVFHADPRRPRFQRQNDLITQWGGPNADNVYRHARVEPGRRYRIRGRMHACEELVLAVRAGFMHQPTWGTLLEVTATELGLGPGDDIDISVGDGGQVPLPDGALTISIREYYFRWDEAEPATMVIECVDDDAVAPAPRPTSAEVAARLDEGVLGAEHSFEYWNRYLREHGERQAPNTFGETFGLTKGLDAARYGFCFWELGPDDALVVELPRPRARYWSFQLYELAWFELLDVTERQSTLNHTQLVVDHDERIRVVVSHRDPGVANWLDAGGRHAGLLSFRCFWADAAPTSSARVVPVAEVAAALPPDTTTVDARARTAALQARRRHLAWRFRT